jgi:hypothetical protein
MGGSGTWVSYSDTAEIVLAALLAAAAAAVACAGIRLPLPARPPRPGRAAKIMMLSAWVLAIGALLASVAVYIRQLARVALGHTPRPDPITPVTLTGVAVVFFAIALAHKESGWRVAVGSAAAGAAAAPMIFELPFDLVIMPRTYPLVDPGLYRLLLFGTLIGADITTLALLAMSPVMRVHRATLWCLAGMLALLAVWALFGFAYPSAPGPITLNMLSKILALVTALTLFLPRRPARRQAPPPDGGQQSEPASPPRAVDSPAFTEIAADRQLAGRSARSSIRGAGRARCRLLAGVMCGVLVLALAAAGCSSASPHAGAPGKAAGQAGPVWVCRPGQKADPCVSDLAATTVTVGGALKPTTWPHSAASKFACFYVHGSDGLTGIGNTSLAVVTTVDIPVAKEQAAPFSQVCQVWAPTYRSQTLPTVAKGLAGDAALMRSTFTVAYDSVLPAWQWFLAHTGGKPVILIGDSQGAAVLIHLISAQLDHQPSVLRRLLVAILVGGNLQVPAGKTAGATFTQVPLCTAATQTGCAIAFSSYPSQPPADSVFARPGQGVSLQSGQTARAGQQVACVNPAALAGGTGDLSPYLMTATQTSRYEIDSGRLTEHVSTPWVTYPGLYSAACEHGGGASWFQVTSLAGTSHTRPVVNDNQVDGVVDTGPAWGYHGYEYNLALGNLLRDVVGEEAAWESSH